jgi:site-specific DNA-cytosine methylase
LGIVIGSLAELGYGVAYRILDAQYFGVPQRRRRIFIVGCLGDNGRTPAEILAIGEGRRGYLAESKSKGKATSRSTAKSPRIVDSLTVSDLIKGQTNNQAINAGLLQVTDVVC